MSNKPGTDNRGESISNYTRIMIPIKVQCGCGQKYAFDVEPVDGLMGYSVLCPVCGIDGTAAANQLIAQHFAGQRSTAPALRLDRHPSPPAVQPAIPRDLPNLSRARNSSHMRARKKWLLPTIGGLVVLAVAGAAFVARNLTQSQHTAGASTAVSDSFPHTLTELNPWYVEPPSGQNAATFYAQGFNSLVAVNSDASSLPLLGKGKLPPLGTLLSVSMRSSLSGFVRSNKDALQWFVQGAKYEQSRYPLDLSLGIETPLPHLGKFRKAVQLLELSAIVHAEANEGLNAANDVLIALSLTRSLETEPVLSSQMVRAASVSVAVGALEQTVNRVALLSESLSELSKAFQHIEDWDSQGEGLTRGLIDERASWTALLRTPEKLLELVAAPGMDVPAELRDRMVVRLQKHDKLTQEEQFFQSTFQQLLAARKDALPNRLKVESLIQQNSVEARGKKLAVIEWMLSGLAETPAKEAECLASARLGLTAIALEQFRAAHDNRYPAALSELMPAWLSAVPLDPFDGQPLRYRTKGSGYALYSIGPDLKDDGGERKTAKTGDILFEVVTPGKIGSMIGKGAVAGLSGAPL
jgi:hypothetical protein